MLLIIILFGIERLEKKRSNKLKEKAKDLLMTVYSAKCFPFTPVKDNMDMAITAKRNP